MLPLILFCKTRCPASVDLPLFFSIHPPPLNAVHFIAFHSIPLSPVLFYSILFRCILAGDHQQLPPTIVSREAAKGGLEKTLMERVIKRFEDQAVHMLTTQYRLVFENWGCLIVCFID